LAAEPKYHLLIEQGTNYGANLENIDYPAAFGSKGELIGIALAHSIGEGEIILDVPCTSRVDFDTIMASEVGEAI